MKYNNDNIREYLNQQSDEIKKYQYIKIQIEILENKINKDNKQSDFKNLKEFQNIKFKIEKELKNQKSI